MDVNLPWVDGYELCRLLKSHHSLSKVPLIFVSARKEEEDVRRGFDAGCNDYITKPFDVDKMTGTISTILSVGSERPSA